MEGEWAPVVLEDLVEVKHGFAFPGEFFSDEPPGDVLLTPGNFAIGGGFKDDKFKYYRGPVSDDFVLAPGDLLVTMTDLSKASDTLGYPALVPESTHRFLHNQRIGKIEFKPNAGLDLHFLYYLLCTREYRDEVLASATGTTVKHTSPTRIGKFGFGRPSLDKQQAIAYTLRVLDDKIELNKKMNETLEAMARALFKSWFVDFDPVRAKAEGRDPSLPAHIAALFPDSFEDSILNEIPMGWRATTLGAETERHGGRIQTGPFGSQLHASDYSEKGVPVVMPQDISNRRVSTARIARIREFDAKRLSRHRLEAGDIIYSRRGDVERHAQISSMEAGWLCGTGCLLVRMGPRWPTSMFISLALDRAETRSWITQHAIGATMPNLNTGILSAVPLVVPPDDLLREFSRLVAPIERLISARNEESLTLAELRDSLLPRLISGEIPISGVQRNQGA